MVERELRESLSTVGRAGAELRITNLRIEGRSRASACLAGFQYADYSESFDKATDSSIDPVLGAKSLDHRANGNRIIADACMARIVPKLLGALEHWRKSG